MTATRNIKLLLLLFCLLLGAYFFVIILAPLQGESPFVAHYGKAMGVADFAMFFEAGVIAASPDHFKIYDPAVQTYWINQLIAPEKMDGPFYIQYPPWFFTLMAPLSFLTIRPAYVLWVIGWPILFSLGLWLNLRLGAIDSKLDRALFIGMVLISMPCILGLKLGQTSVGYFTFMCFFWYFFRTGKDKQAAAFLAVSSVKLQYAFFYLILIPAAKRFRLFAWSALFETILLSVTMLNVGWHNFQNYPAWLHFVESTGATGVSPDAMINLQGLLLPFISHKTAMLVNAAGFVIALLYVGSVWWRNRQLPPGSKDAWAIAITISLGLITGLHVHYHDCILLAIPAAYTLKSLSLPETARDTSPAYRVWALCILFYPLLSWLCYIYRQDTPVALIGILNVILAAAAITIFESIQKTRTIDATNQQQQT